MPYPATLSLRSQRFEISTAQMPGQTCPTNRRSPDLAVLKNPQKSKFAFWHRSCLGSSALCRNERIRKIKCRLRNQLEKETEISRAILHYLQVHPDAKDTLQGIAEWWLLKEWTEQKFQQIEASISDLVSRGLVVERRREGSSPYYWLNRTKQDEISRILKSREP